MQTPPETSLRAQGGDEESGLITANQTKRCRCCGEHKLLSCYYVHSRSGSYRNECKTCFNKRSRLRERNKPEAVMLSRARKRSKEFGIPFDLTLSDIFIPDVCPILGIPLKTESLGRTGPAFNSPSLDRIIPERGYVKGNVAVISFKANAIKQNATSEELLAVAAWLSQFEKPENHDPTIEV